MLLLFSSYCSFKWIVMSLRGRLKIELYINFHYGLRFRETFRNYYSLKKIPCLAHQNYAVKPSSYSYCYLNFLSSFLRAKKSEGRWTRSKQNKDICNLTQLCVRFKCLAHVPNLNNMTINFSKIYLHLQLQLNPIFQLIGNT